LLLADRSARRRNGCDKPAEDPEILRRSSIDGFLPPESRQSHYWTKGQLPTTVTVAVS
jgi:hypothetical protein